MSQPKKTPRLSKTGALPADLSTASESTITILRWAVWTEDRLLAGPMDSNAEVGIPKRGTADTISVYFAAQLSGLDVVMFKKLAAAGGHFVHLVWIFTGNLFPKVSSRHVLVETDGAADITFDGGLGWASGILEREQALQKARASSVPRPQVSSLQPEAIHQPHPLKLPCQASYLGGLEAVADPLAPRFLPPGFTYETTSTLPSSTGWRCGSQDECHLDQPDSPGPLCESSVATERSTPELENVIDDEWTVELQITIEILERKRRDAEDLFARCGDPSGLASVMQLASQSTGVWLPSGLPRF